MSQRRLVAVCQPLDDGSGYDYAAIARALTTGQRRVLAQIAGEAAPDSELVAQSLVEAGLALGGDPPRLSMLGEAVLELGLAGPLDG